MIQINIDQKTNRQEIECSGCLDDIIAELYLAIHKIYNVMADADEEAGADFRRLMSTAMTMPDCPVWVRVEGIPAKVEVFQEVLVEALNEPTCPCWDKNFELHEDETLTSARFGERRNDD